MVDTVSSSSVITATNPLPTQILPSPVEMEHVSTSPDLAKTVNLREPGQPCLTLGHRGPGPTAKLMIQKVKTRGTATSTTGC